MFSRRAGRRLSAGWLTQQPVRDTRLTLLFVQVYQQGTLSNVITQLGFQPDATGTHPDSRLKAVSHVRFFHSRLDFVQI